MAILRGHPRQRMAKSKWFRFATILLLALSTLARTARAQDDDDDPDRKPVVKAADQGPDAARGHKIFQQNCGVCHANDATGGRRPQPGRSPPLPHARTSAPNRGT